MVGSPTKRIWKLLAYLGRYGHQSVDVMKKLTVRELGVLAAQLAELVSEENTPAHQTNR